MKVNVSISPDKSLVVGSYQFFSWTVLAGLGAKPLDYAQQTSTKSWAGNWFQGDAT